MTSRHSLRRNFVFLTGLISTVAAIPVAQAAASIAATYPMKPIRVIVPFAAGGGADIVTRALGQKLAEAYMQPVVVDNRAGANAIAGTDIVAKAPPDGYTLLMATSAHVINPSVSPNLPFNTVSDFAPVTQVTTQAYILCVYPECRQSRSES